MNSKVPNDADPNSLSIEQAHARIQNDIQPNLDAVTINCANALGRILSDDVHAAMDVPPFRASAMDGYAIRHSDASKQLKIIAHSYAGHPAENLLPAGSCVRITTGARVPDEADTVVQQENVEINEQSVKIQVQPSKGLHVRPSGSDQKKGTKLLNTGDRLGPAALAVLSAQGISTVSVYRSVRIGVFSTGDELRASGETLKSGQIYDANRPLLLSLLESPAVDCTDLGVAKDTLEGITEILSKSDQFDLMVSTGGVSVGDADFVRAALSAHGEIDLWKIAIKPGRPLTFGRLNSGAAFFGLPGNPVSAAVTCLIFILPALQQLMNRTIEPLLKVQAVSESNLTKARGRVEYQRGLLTQNANGELRVATTGLQDSHVMTSLQKANALVVLDELSEGCAAGDLVQVIPMSQFSEQVL